MDTTQFPRMHVSLYVSNLQKSMQFYDAFFGQNPVKTKPGYAKYILERPSLIISFIENPAKVQANFGHLGFQVETEEEMYRRLSLAQSLGLVSKEEIGTACCYAVQDKFWATDPDGVQWEVYYFHEDTEFNDPHYELESVAACCFPAPDGEKQQSQKKKVSLSALGKPGCEPDNGCC